MSDQEETSSDRGDSESESLIEEKLCNEISPIRTVKSKSYRRSSLSELKEEVVHSKLKSPPNRYRYDRYSRSRSRSPPRHKTRYSSDRRSPFRHRRHSRSPHRYSRSPFRQSHKPYRQAHSYEKYNRSPSQRRYHNNRDDPSPNRCLGIFGLSFQTNERNLKQVFGKYGSLENIQVIYDAQTGRSRGFAFIYYNDIEDAKVAKDKCNGMVIDGRMIRVDYSISKRAHSPTPGVYMGRSVKSRDYHERDRFTPSPHSRRHRSNSYSPRRYPYY